MGSGFLAGILYAMRQARRFGLDPEQIFNLSFWIMLSGILGARFVYVLIDIAQKGHASEFVSLNPIPWFAIWEGGLVWYGGFIGAALVTILYAWRHKMAIWKVCDILAPGTFLGLGIGRLGCMMAGDDFGRPTTVPWAIRFTNPEALVYPPSLLGQPLHPTQLYMHWKSMTVALTCHLVLTRWKRFDGQVLCVAVVLYAILRAIVEAYRGDFDRGFVPFTHQHVSTSQGIGIVMVLLGIVLWRVFRSRATVPHAVTPPAPLPAEPIPQT